jgi:hypothetical protein
MYLFRLSIAFGAASVAFLIASVDWIEIAAYLIS